MEVIERTIQYPLHFIDDQVVTAQYKHGIKLMTNRLLQEYGRWRLSVNGNKTKYLCIDEGSEDLFSR